MKRALRVYHALFLNFTNCYLIYSDFHENFL